MGKCMIRILVAEAVSWTVGDMRSECGLEAGGLRGLTAVSVVTPKPLVRIADFLSARVWGAMNPVEGVSHEKDPENTGPHSVAVCCPAGPAALATGHGALAGRGGRQL